NDNDAWVYLFLCAIANYSSNILMIIHIRKKLDLVAFKRANLFRNVWLFLVKGWYIFLSQASVTLISYANIFFLPLVLEPKNFVVFSTAERIVKVLSI
ncbi:flippase, partial [Escherichia marmotae]|nr:flippase [Escherichia marmotae]